MNPQKNKARFATAVLVGVLLGGVLMLGGCGSSEPQIEPEDVVSGVGTVVYVELEGGFYGIEARNGARYLPLNLDAAFQEDGMDVRFRAEFRDTVLTIQQWGRPVQLLDILPVTFDEDR